MNLYCVFGGSNLSRNLLVEPARDDHGDDFPLSRCQRFEALPQHCNFRFSLTSGPIPLQRDLNRIQQILIAEWLSEEFNGSRLHGSHRHRDIAVRGDKDDRNRNVSFSQFLLEVEPTCPWEPNVEDEATGYIRTLGLQKLMGGPEQLSLQSYRLDETLDCPTNRWIVVHYKNSGCWLSHKTPFPIWAGKVN